MQNNLAMLLFTNFSFFLSSTCSGPWSVSRGLVERWVQGPKQIKAIPVCGVLSEANVGERGRGGAGRGRFSSEERGSGESRE